MLRKDQLMMINHHRLRLSLRISYPSGWLVGTSVPSLGVSAYNFLGQPNVGKSSLLNALFGTHKVKASRTPGKVLFSESCRSISLTRHLLYLDKTLSDAILDETDPAGWLSGAGIPKSCRPGNASYGWCLAYITNTSNTLFSILCPSVSSSRRYLSTSASKWERGFSWG